MGRGCSSRSLAYQSPWKSPQRHKPGCIGLDGSGQELNRSKDQSGDGKRDADKPSATPMEPANALKGPSPAAPNESEPVNVRPLARSSLQSR